MNKKKAVILSPAHGKGVSGKESPDGAYKEYIMSRRVLNNAVNMYLRSNSDNVDLYFPFVQAEYETPIIDRVMKYNETCLFYDEVKVIEWHSNANHPSTCDKDGWNHGFKSGRGVSVWTSRGQDGSDVLAQVFFDFFKPRFPELIWREQKYSDGDSDYEADFAILYGSKKRGIKPLYDSILVEWLFHNNIYDINFLMNSSHLQKAASTLCEFLKTL